MERLFLKNTKIAEVFNDYFYKYRERSTDT